MFCRGQNMGVSSLALNHSVDSAIAPIELGARAQPSQTQTPLQAHRAGASKPSACRILAAWQLGAILQAWQVQVTGRCQDNVWKEKADSAGARCFGLRLPMH